MISIIIMGNLFTTCLIVTTIILCIPTLAIAIDNTRYDLDRSGSIDPGDIDVLYRYINDPTAPYLPYDLNNDSEVNIYDMQLVTSHIGEPVSWPSPNLLANPGFEYGTTTPINWTFVTSNASSPSWDANVSHTGARSIRIQVTGTQDDISGYPRSDMITARPLTYYNFSARVKTLGTNGTNAPAVRVVELDAARKMVRQTNLTFGKGTNDWTQKQVVFRTDINTSYVYVDAGIVNGYGTFWVDDVYFELFAPELVVSISGEVASLVNKSPEINMSIKSSNLDTFKFNWNGTNYSFYDSSLVLAMNFNNNSAIGENGTRAVDISKYGNNGTMYNMNIGTNNCTGICSGWDSSGKYDGGISFDGVNDYIDVTNTAGSDMDNITIEAWIKPISRGNYRGIVTSASSSGNSKGFKLYLNNPGNLCFKFGNGTIGYITISSFVIPLNQYTYVAVTLNSTNLTLYKNNVSESYAPSVNFNNSFTNVPILIGRTFTDLYSDNFFNGSIDEIRIYNRSLSTDEIKMEYISEFQKLNSTDYRLYTNVSFSSNITTNHQVGHLSNPALYPIGGGVGYTKMINSLNATYSITNKSELLSALSTAVSGDIIYINDNSEINLTDQSNLIIPAGVTLASGRGNGSSQGALLYSNYSVFTNGTAVDYILFKTGGAGVRMTGIRFRGGDGEKHYLFAQYTYSRGFFSRYNVEIDNSELYNWSNCAVCLYNNSSSQIHHNYIHNNRGKELGYGVVLNGGSNATIEANTFGWNGHSIAGDGRVNTSYTARYNLVLEHGEGHGFDMHGGAARQDGTNLAGKIINIYQNTFNIIKDENGSVQNAIDIRGIPEVGAYINNNYFYYPNQSYIIQSSAFGNMSIYNNCFLGICDYIPDGTYAYSGWASDFWGNSNKSEIRTITVNRVHG